jgi:uncharacterized protein involved in exopolysaccharide biosynthesis
LRDPKLDHGKDEVAGLVRLVEALSERRGTFYASFLATALLVQVIGFLWPATYAAQAAILVQKARLSAQLDSDPQAATTVVTGGVSEEEVNSEIAVLTSNEVLARTVQAAGLDRVAQPWYLRALFAPLRAYESLHSWYHGVPNPTGADRAMQGVARSITAERLKDSNVVVITFEAGDPRVAETALAEVLKQYQDRHISVHGRRDAATFFSEQAELLANELERDEDELRTLKKQADAVDVTAERDVQLKLDASLREEAASLDRRLAELDAKLSVFRRRVTDAAGGAARSEPSPIRDLTRNDLKTEVLRLELEQVHLRARFRDDAPLVVENQRKLDIARQTLEEHRKAVFENNPTLAAVDQERALISAERAGVVERRRKLEEQVKASRLRLMELDENVTLAARKQRRIRAAEERYMMYLTREEKARIDSALDHSRFTNVTVVQQAVASPKPVRPKKWVILLASLGGGLVVGFLTCLWLEIRAMGLANLLTSIAPREGAA